MNRLALPLGILASLLTVAGGIVSALVEWTGWGDLVFVVSFALLGIACGITGGIVAAKVPGNAVGWLILGIGLSVGLVLSSSAYAEVAISTSVGPLTGQAVAAWFSASVGISGFFGVTGFLLLLFPTGHLPSPAWRWWPWCFAAMVTIATLSNGLIPGDIEPGVENPFAVTGTAASVARTVTVVTDWTALPGLLLCALALAVRLRGSRGVERLQLKWFAYAAAMTGTGLGLSIVTDGPLADASFLLAIVGLIMLPVTAGVAILRHRLYDIDVVIKRTLVYGSLTAALVTTYLVLVLTLHPLLRPVAGDSNLAVAASTLAVAALFRPLRSAIQRGVDRRFFRSRYDAARTLDEFSERLRHELDLDSLGSDLRTVVTDTMQPAHVSLWLRRDS